MWPLAGRTVLESLRVLDWVDEHFGAAGPRVAGSVSMGGDVAVALLCGAADLHGPAEVARRFRTALCERDPRSRSDAG